MSERSEIYPQTKQVIDSLKENNIRASAKPNTKGDCVVFVNPLNGTLEFQELDINGKILKKIVFPIFNFNPKRYSQKTKEEA